MTRRERLRARRVPPIPVTIRTGFTPAADEAFAEVERAQQALFAAQASGARLGEAEARLVAAREATAELVETFQVGMVPPPDYDGLIGDNPPSEEQRKAGAMWDHATFVPALLAACVDQGTEDQLSAAEWAADIKDGVYASGELARLFDACLTVNDRSLDVRVGKD